MCRNSSTAAQISSLSLSVLQQLESDVQPWYYTNFFQQKQEAQSNPRPTQGLSPGSGGTGATALWFAHLSLFSHTNRNTWGLCSTTHIRRQRRYPLTVPTLYLFRPKENSPNCATQSTDLFATYDALLYHAHSGDSLTCCARVNHRESAARLTVVLRVMEILLALSGEAG